MDSTNENIDKLVALEEDKDKQLNFFYKINGLRE